MGTGAFGSGRAPAAVVAWDAAASVAAALAGAPSGLTVPCGLVAALASGGRSVACVLPTHPAAGRRWLTLVLDDGTAVVLEAASGAVVCVTDTAAPLLAGDAAAGAGGWLAASVAPHAACFLPPAFGLGGGSGAAGGDALLCTPQTLLPRDGAASGPRTALTSASSGGGRTHFRGSEGAMVVDAPAVPPRSRLAFTHVPATRTGAPSSPAGRGLSAADSDALWRAAALSATPAVAGLAAGDAVCIARPHPRLPTSLLVGTTAGDLLLLADVPAA